MKHFRATPVRGTPGEPIVARGLRALYEAANERWGMVATYASVRNNFLPDGRIYRVNDDGWILITRAPDADEAYEIEQENRVVNDDREQDYMADVFVTVHEDGKDWVEQKWQRVRARGLINLIGEAAKLVEPVMRGLPPSLTHDAVKARLSNLRSQMSKSRSANKPSYSIAFPPVKEGHWKGPANLLYRVYVDVAASYEPLPENLRGFTRREKEHNPPGDELLGDESGPSYD